MSFRSSDITMSLILNIMWPRATERNFSVLLSFSQGIINHPRLPRRTTSQQRSRKHLPHNPQIPFFLHHPRAHRNPHRRPPLPRRPGHHNLSGPVDPHRQVCVDSRIDGAEEHYDACVRIRDRGARRGGFAPCSRRRCCACRQKLVP